MVLNTTFPNICPKIHTWLNYPLKMLKVYFQGIKMVFGEYKIKFCSRENQGPIVVMLMQCATCDYVFLDFRKCQEVCFFWNVFFTAAVVQGITPLVKRAFQGHRKYYCSLTCGFCYSRAFLFFLEELLDSFWP